MKIIALIITFFLLGAVIIVPRFSKSSKNAGINHPGQMINQAGAILGETARSVGKEIESLGVQKDLEKTMANVVTQVSSDAAKTTSTVVNTIVMTQLINTFSKLSPSDQKQVKEAICKEN